jgi:hypothetical protein
MQNYDDIETRLARKKLKGKKIATQSFNFVVEVHLRKPQQPNWEHKEVLVLIIAKKDEHIAGLDQVNSRDKFETSLKKWKRISKVMMNACCY